MDFGMGHRSTTTEWHVIKQIFVRGIRVWGNMHNLFDLWQVCTILYTIYKTRLQTYSMFYIVELATFTATARLGCIFSRHNDGKITG